MWSRWQKFTLCWKTATKKIKPAVSFQTESKYVAISVHAQTQQKTGQIVSKRGSM